MSKYDVRYLMHGGKSEEVEGKAHNRIVVIEFPTHEAVLTFPYFLVACAISATMASAAAFGLPASTMGRPTTR